MKVITAISVLLFSLPTFAGWGFFGSDTVKDDEQIIFFPAEATLQDDKWNIYIHGWIFEPGSLAELGSLFRKTLGIDADDVTEKNLFQKRISWFLVDNERGKQIKIKLGQQQFKLNKSVSNGHFFQRITIPEKTMQSLLASQNSKTLIDFRAVLGDKDKRLFQGEIHRIPRHGLSVISDIDDTIKISNVTDKKELLANTFLRPFRAVPGMSALYQQWQAEKSAVFHYVSASPWQLYPPLSSFMNSAGFPRGSFYMKLFSWKDSSFFKLFSDPVNYKIDVIETILKRYPRRRFILVGDSGEKDPEVYGRMARKYRQQIKHILIRQVGNNNSGNRFDSAFKDLDKNLWQVFRYTGEIKALSLDLQ